MRLLFHKLYSFFILFFCLSFFSGQYKIPEKPKVLYPIFDEVGVLKEQEKKQLNEKLIAFADSTSTEIEVIVIPSTKGEDVNFLATMFGEKWGIGQKKVDNGVVFLIAVDDHTMSIQQGRAVEQYLTASVAGQILDDLVTPQFKKGNWFGGIDEGTSAIMKAVQGKFKPKKAKEDDGYPGFGIFIIILIIIVIFIIVSKGGNDGNNNFFDDDITLDRRGRRRSAYIDILGGILGGMGGSGSRGSGGDFGGFGGGGSFGGGGASGGW